MFSCEKIIVFDLEATCWEGRENAYKWREVISLGACILDLKTLEISDKFHMLCKPVRGPKTYNFSPLISIFSSLPTRSFKVENNYFLTTKH